MKIVILKSLLFVLLFWMLSFAGTKMLNHVFIRDRVHKEMWNMSQTERSVGYAVLGSSRAFNNVDAITLQKKVEADVINLGCGGYSLLDMYLSLHIFLKRNHAKTVLLQIDGSDLDYSHKFMAQVYLPYMSDPVVTATVNESAGFRRVLANAACPLSRYWEYNDFYNWQRLEELRTISSPYDATQGSQLLYDDSYRVFPKIVEEPRFRVDQRSREYLERIVQLAQQQGIQLIMFSAPEYHRDEVFRNYDQAARAYIVEYCESHRIPYLDFSDANFDVMEFRDYGHLNSKGALRFTDVLAASVRRESANAGFATLGGLRLLAK